MPPKKRYGTFDHSKTFVVKRKNLYDYTKEEQEIVYDMGMLVHYVKRTMCDISKLYFADEVKKQAERYKSAIYVDVSLEYQLQIANCAFEKTLEFNKKPTWLGYITKEGWRRKK